MSRKKKSVQLAMHLSDNQSTFIISDFDSQTHALAHTRVWSRRSYAPMYIHRPDFQDVFRCIQAKFPNYVIAFDVVFESNGSEVGWHCDHESLGPFEVEDRYTAVRDAHFMTIHFNLTNRGGSLRTLPWIYLSYIYYLTIECFGIFSTMHWLLIGVSRPFFWMFAKDYPNTKCAGNEFDNTRLHMVTSGDKRISYVVRLVKKGCVGISNRSVEAGIRRSNACTAFHKLSRVVSNRTMDVDRIQWGDLSEPGT
jgi:hypothetical protein